MGDDNNKFDPLPLCVSGCLWVMGNSGIFAKFGHNNQPCKHHLEIATTQIMD